MGLLAGPKPTVINFKVAADPLGEEARAEASLTLPRARENGRTTQMDKHVNGDLIIRGAFDYAALETALAKRTRATADRIRQMIRNSLENIIEIGTELVAVKNALPHGQFGKWLDVEFGWSERTVRNFMAVAQCFGKSANFADLPIQLSAA
jgi:hypothetical protein